MCQCCHLQFVFYGKAFVHQNYGETILCCGESVSIRTKADKHVSVVIYNLFFMAKHSFIKTVAKLYFAAAKVFLFALVLINVSVLSFTICFLWRNNRSSKLW